MAKMSGWIVWCNFHIGEEKKMFCAEQRHYYEQTIVKKQ